MGLAEWGSASVMADLSPPVRWFRSRVTFRVREADAIELRRKPRYPRSMMESLRALVIRAATCSAVLVAACVGSTASQYPTTGSGDAGVSDGGAFQGACDTETTWQVAAGSGASGSTLTFSIPASDDDGGAWSPAAGLTYSFAPGTCTVSLATSGCPGVGTFNLKTRACTLLTQGSCEAGPCDSACPTRPSTCALTGL
jgi:hypothetical protein